MDEECFDATNLFSTFEPEKDTEQNAIDSKSKRKRSTSLTELDSLKQENKLLKKVLRKIACTSGQDNAPVASIVYYDRPCSRGKQADIEEFIKQFASTKDGKTETDGKSELYNASIVEPSALEIQKGSFCDAFALALGKGSGLSEEEEEDEESLGLNVSCIPVGSVQYFGSFCLDSFGSVVVTDAQPPIYEQVYFRTLPDNDSGSKRSRRPKMICFNCDGEHKIQDCKQPRDLVKISAKRQEFLKNFTSPAIQEARYHADKEREKKFSHLLPGKVSEDLRQALSLSPHDLPPFIYRMRMLGYPPGWSHSDNDSGIVMYGKEGKAEESNGEEKSSDPEQLVHFPGFNVPAPKGAKELSNEIHLPKMNQHHQLHVQPAASPPVEDAGRKHHHSSECDNDSHASSKRRRTSGTETDMDIEHDSDAGLITVQKTGDDDVRPPGTGSPSVALETYRTSTPTSSKRGIDLEDGEIPDSPPGGKGRNSILEKKKIFKKPKDLDKPSWWLEEPLVSILGKNKTELVAPPFPLRPLPLHKISQILPGDMNHISFEDRNMWLDPIFGNLQVRTGRYEKLKTILASRESKK